MSDKTPFTRSIEECENFIDAAACPKCMGGDVEATLRAEVARLTAELADANFARSTMMGGCDSLANQLVVAKANVARLTAEVERLEGRVWDAAALLRYGALSPFGAKAERPFESAEAWNASRDAWLAGCKP